MKPGRGDQLMEDIRFFIKDVREYIGDLFSREELKSVIESIESEVAPIEEQLQRALQSEDKFAFRAAVHGFRDLYRDIRPANQVRMPESGTPKKGFHFYYALAIRKIFDRNDRFLITLINKSKQFGYKFTNPSLTDIMVEVYMGTVPLRILQIIEFAINNVLGDNPFKEQ